MSLVDRAIKETGSSALVEAKAHTRFVRKLEIEGSLIDKVTLKFLVEAAKEISAPYAHNLEFLYALSRNKIQSEFRSLDDCVEAIKTYLNKDKIKGYVFSREEDGIIYPWLVTGLTSETEQRASYGYSHNSAKSSSGSAVMRLLGSVPTSNEPTTKSIYINAYALRSFFVAKEIEFEEKNIKKQDYFELINCIAAKPVKVHEFFEYLSLYKETTDLYDIYEKHLVRFKAFLYRYGAQFVVKGSAEVDSGNWYSGSTIDLSVDNSPGRCIMTTVPAACTMNSEARSDPNSRNTNRNIFGRRKSKMASDENSFLVDVNDLDIPLRELDINDIEVQHTWREGQTSKEETAPLHPVLQVFHLTHHQVFDVHVANMAPYKYQDNIKDQLILPEEMKELSEMLVSTGEEDNDDIIENKSKATIIACIGDPGLGKTLLAEVISEECKKPLYKIQAAQLGMTHEELEVNLSIILKRAEAWNCVLMIDEANAYIHERGHDIKQNAIVGVFLRLLEYFSGTLILTTNHAGPQGGIDIDDAIVSRCSAVFRFTTPTKENAAKIWKLQAKLLKIKLSDDLIDTLSTKYKISGRSIRNLLRLANRYAKRIGAEALVMKHFIVCSQYVPTTQSETFTKTQ